MSDNQDAKPFVASTVARQMALDQVPEFRAAMDEVGKQLFYGAIALRRAGFSAEQAQDLILDILTINERYAPTLIELTGVVVEHEEALSKVMEKAIKFEVEAPT